jgi:hypothetical protein
MTKAQVEETYGRENVTWVERPRKHRYVFINAKGRRRAKLLVKLRYATLPYPKGDAHHAEDIAESVEHYDEQLALF